MRSMTGSIAAVLALSSCPPALAALVTVKASHVAATCPSPGDAQLLELIDDAARFDALFPGTGPSGLFGRDVVWQRERVVLFALDQKPTLGYSVQLARRWLSARQRTLTLPVKLVEPRPDQKVQTALSRPCVVAIVTRANWSKARVIDKRGTELASASLD